MIKCVEIREGEPLQILCLGAHCDDIEIGCGATIRMLADRPGTQIDWVVLSSNDQRRPEAEAGATYFAGKAKRLNVDIQAFRNGFFPFVAAEIKEYFEELKGRVKPDLIFTHFKKDAHQDHRTVAELTWNTFRDHMILEYEIPKYDGDIARPGFFVTVTEADADYKIKGIIECFESQQGRQWFDEETFRSLLRLRGIESNSSTRYAEAFFARKAVFKP